MGIFDMMNKSKGSANPEGELRQLIVQVKDAVAEMVKVLGSLSPPIRDDARSSYSESVGETPEETLKKLTKMERRLQSGSLESIPRSEISSLRDRMKRLDSHLAGNDQGTKDLPEDRAGRKALRSSIKDLSVKVRDLIKGLDKAIR